VARVASNPPASRNEEPAAEPFRLRIADIDDVRALTGVERDAFPTQWPSVQFRRELRRPRTSYIVAVRDLPKADPTSDPEADGRPLDTATGASETADVESDSAGIFSRLFRGLMQIALVEPSEENEPPPRDYMAGYVGIWFVAGEAHIVSIAVRDRDRRQGVGELLLVGAFAEARRRDAKELTLEVRRSNRPAAALYCKYGFREAGVRKRYYVDDGEDAIIMTTPPIANVEYASELDALARNHAARWGHSVQARA
jgi:ribosomal-protein-alanine N-acetyltransferase